MSETPYIVFEPRPAKLSAAIAMSAAIVAVLMIGATSILLAIPTGLVGLVLVGLGLLSGYRTAVGIGVGSIFFGLLVVGSFLNAPVEALLVGVLAIIVTWDVGENAISIGEQLGREAPTTSTEVVHGAGSIFLGGLGAGIVYVVYVTGTGGRPLPALVMMIVAVVALGWLIRT